MTHIPPPHGSGHGHPNYPHHLTYPDPNAGPPSNSSPGTPSGGLPSPSFIPPHQTQTQSQSQVQQPPTDRSTTSSAATALLHSFPPFSQVTDLITSLTAELDSLKARQRIWKRLAHAAVLFSSDHELRYSLLDKCNDLAECMKSPSASSARLREEVSKMNEVELQLFSISSTAKQLLQDAEWVRAEDVRGFVEGVRGVGGQIRVNGNGGNGGEGQTLQVRLDRGRGDVGRRLNYLMVTSQSQGPGQAAGGGQGGQGQGETMMGEGSSRRSSTTAAARSVRGQQQQQPTSHVQNYLAAQAVAAAETAASSATGSSRSQSQSNPQLLPQSQTQQEEITWSPANASAASSAGRASPGPSEGSSTGPGHGPNRARWWDTVITDSDTDQRRRSESNRNLPQRERGDAGSDCDMEM